MVTFSEVTTTLRCHQFIGYWGDVGRQALGCLQGFASQWQHQKGPAWEIWFRGNAQPCALPCRDHPDRLTLTLAASGLPTADAWVTVGDDRLILGRDPFGRMPLYWLQRGSALWFASRLEWLLPLVNQPQVNLAGVYGYSCFSYVPTPLTPVESIFTAPAGGEQIWDTPQGSPLVRRSQEWQEAPTQLESETTAVTHLQTLLKEAVQHQLADLTSDPVGVFLSGGLDSSIIAALLVQAGVKVRAYTLDFGEAGIPEAPYAEQVAQHLQIPLVKVAVTPRRIRQALIPTVRSLDLPFGDGVTVPLYLLAQAASQDTRIIFNGEGGDQLFAGWTNKPLIAAGVYEPGSLNQSTFAQHYLRTFHRLWGYESQVFQPEVVDRVQAIDPQHWLREALDPAHCTALLHRLRRATLMLKGAQNIHPRATNLAQAHGLQVRSPFCHLPLAHWAFQVSGEHHLQGACEKYILKRAVEPWLPPEIVWRPKRGMGVPLTAWCLQALWHQMGIWLNPARLQAEGIWQPHLANHIVLGKLGTIQGRRVGEILWLLLVWQVWREAVLGQSSSKYALDHPFWLPAPIGRHYLRFRRTLDL